MFSKLLNQGETEEHCVYSVVKFPLTFLWNSTNVFAEINLNIVKDQLNKALEKTEWYPASR
jgi:hypothetical protein